MSPTNWKFDTLAVHAGYSPDPTTKAVAVPIYQTVAYSFDSAQHGAARRGFDAVHDFGGVLADVDGLFVVTHGGHSIKKKRRSSRV